MDSPNEQGVAQQKMAQENRQVFDNSEYVKWKNNNSPQSQKYVNLSSSSYVYGSWQQNKIGQICQQMEEWKVSALWISDNKEQNILKHISDINFTNLIRIDVMGNNIQSIQILCRLSMPQLAQIYLQDNKIHEIRSMRRCLFPKLYFIGLGTKNCIQDGYALTDMPAAELQWIGCESQSCDIYCYDIRWIAKLCSNKINKIQLQNNLRTIRNNKVDESFHRRFQTLSIDRM